MKIKFIILQQRGPIEKPLPHTIQLIPNNWNDYSFKTLFSLHYTDKNGEKIELGSVKIGFKGQKNTESTLDKIPSTFNQLSDHWFSVGQSVEYYLNFYNNFTANDRKEILESLRDVAFCTNAFRAAENEDVFITSLLRNFGEQTIHNQYRRVLKGAAALTDYDFSYIGDNLARKSSIDLHFKVKANSKPPTNIHVLIGSNGIGKTTILNGMIKAIHPDYQRQRTGKFQTAQHPFPGNQFPNNYFSSLISVSFSPFDPFQPPLDDNQSKKGPKYFYVGMKNRAGSAENDTPTLKSEQNLAQDFRTALEGCATEEAKISRWISAIDTLSLGASFSRIEFLNLIEQAKYQNPPSRTFIESTFNRMSSGHKIVLLTITSLVNLVVEKTLILMDEPESHLHPPLLSAFTRTLSDLLHYRNGIAIVATHSPVVVQEVPRSCVWILNRSGTEWQTYRPARETFAENVGILTKEIFGLQTTKSGFHALLQEAVNTGASFDKILNDFNEKIGMEGTSILMAMISARDSNNTRDKN